MLGRNLHNVDPHDADGYLAEIMAGEFYADPYGFAMFSYEWGKGELEFFDGPDDWQKGFLVELGQEIRGRDFDGFTPCLPIQFSTTSGHGIGKSALTAIVVDFIMSTRPHAKGMMSANTAPQLETKTWAELAKWTRRCITGHWFRITSGRGAMKMVHRLHPETWRLDGMAWRENMPEAFAGLHAQNSTPFYVFDEASGIPRNILETAQGGLTDGEPMMFLFSNPTQNSGFFYDTHHKFRERWVRRQIDSRTVRITNKKLIEQWIEDYGEDSDFVRVRVRGVFPRASARQFIPTDIVEKARKAEPLSNITDPIIMGVDVARYGDDQSVIRFRKGRDARTIPPLKFRGLDTMQFAAIIAEHAKKHLADAVFVDGGGVGGPVIDRLRQLNVPNLHEINFGSQLPAGGDYKYMNAKMWGGLRDALNDGLAIDDSEDLQTDLTAREYYFTPDNRIMLEPKESMKDRGLASPDDADALALTYALPVGPRTAAKTRAAWEGRGDGQEMVQGVDYNPFA